MRGADILVNSLVAAGVRQIFSLSGNQIMPIYDACFETGTRIIHTRHEAAAVYMAEAYAQLTGEVGVALVAAGAGAANALGPLFSARESETPLLLLTGDSPVAQDGRGAFQGLDQPPMTAPVTKSSYRVRRTADLGGAIAEALSIAQSGRQGPVHIALPFDVLNDQENPADLPPAKAICRVEMPPNHEDLTALLKAISAAHRPVVICGPAMNATRFDGLQALADKLDAPVIPMESPRGLNDPSLGDVGKVMTEADLVVNLGKRVDFSLAFGQTGAFATGAGWIDVQPSEAERARAKQNLGARLLRSIVADPRDMARSLIDAAPGGATRSGWRAKVAQHLAARQIPDMVEGRVSPAEITAAVQRQIDKSTDPVLICDGGEFGQWAQANCSAKSRVINGISGAIGGGICYGIGACLARPDATVFCLMGDGTAGFHLAEFETAAREELPMVVVLGNDLRWNAEHQIQMRDYGPSRLIGCQLSDARYDLAAAALGGHGEYVTDAGELDAALERAVASSKPACVNVMIEGLPAPSASAH